MPMGTNIKISLMPKGINQIIYNPGVSISTPEYVLIIPYPYYPGGAFFPVGVTTGQQFPVLSVLVCTQCTFPTNRCDLTNLTLLPLPSLSEDLSGGVAGFDVNPCSCIKWAFRSSEDAKVLPQFFS